MKNKKIAIFYGGKLSKHLVLLRKAAKKMEVDLELISYNKLNFDTQNIENISLSKYDVIFFRTTGKHWEEVNLVVDWVKKNNSKCKIVDPLVEKGRPSDACKAWQMVELTKNMIEVPRTIYGSLCYLRDEGFKKLSFPMVIKGSAGDRGTNVFRVNSHKDLERIFKKLRKIEIEGGKRYMLQEFIPNDGDLRILVLGNKVLGSMKRSSQNFKKEFRNNFSVGGRVEVVEISEPIKKLAIKAAKVCRLLVAGVDIVYRDGDVKRPVVWEVNKGPQFWGFMEATGIDVPREIINFLINL